MLQLKLTNQDGRISYIVLVAVLVLLLAVGGYFLVSENDETNQEEVAIVEEDKAEEEGVEQDELVGDYDGSYRVGGNEEDNPASFTVNPDLTINGTGVMPVGGREFSVSGDIAQDGDFAASGEVEGANTEVTFTGTFDTDVDPITASGDWEAGSMGGTWFLIKQN